MRKFDEYGLKMCQYQGQLFSLSRDKVNCSTPIFLRRFMYSGVARRMDGEGFLFEAITQEDVLGEIEDEFGKSDYGQIKYDEEELYWIGYIYRYWCYTRQVTSRSLYKMIKPEELRKVYYPYHSLDPAQAIERIIEAKGLGEDDYIQRGVEMLREILRRKEQSGDS